eukprot:SAG11_NODE_388_length_9871_cov_18.104585_4_plen_79_part_00
MQLMLDDCVDNNVCVRTGVAFSNFRPHEKFDALRNGKASDKRVAMLVCVVIIYTAVERSQHDYENGGIKFPCNRKKLS